MDLPSRDESIMFDRLIRSYITSFLDDDLYTELDVLETLDDLKDNPHYTTHLMTTLGSVVEFMLNHMVMAEDEEPLDVWKELSLEIEMSLMTGPDGPEV